MSDLQLGLLAVGAAVVVAVIAYNKWQERQYRRKAEASFRSTTEDVLMGGDSPARARPRAAPPGERIEPVLQAVAAPGGEPAVLSAVLDFIVAVGSPEGIAGGRLLQASRGAFASSAGRVRWEGCRDGAAQWEPLRADTAYTMIRAGLQLVDRRGAVTAGQVTEFVAGVQKAAADAGGTATIGDTHAVLEQAADLDRFCGEVDIRIALQLLGEAPFPGERISVLARAHGLVLSEDGGFSRRSDSGLPVYTLSNAEPPPFTAGGLAQTSTRRLLLDLDVPRAPGGEAAFADFVSFAQAAAADLGARIVDDEGRTLSQASFDRIRDQLRPLYQTMEARGLPPGSPLALRLFS